MGAVGLQAVNWIPSNFGPLVEHALIEGKITYRIPRSGTQLVVDPNMSYTEQGKLIVLAKK